MPFQLDINISSPSARPYEHASASKPMLAEWQSWDARIELTGSKTFLAFL